LKWLITIVFLSFPISICVAQDSTVTHVDYIFAPAYDKHVWVQDPALFLEPNNFAVEKEMLDRLLWLKLGYGRDIFEVDRVGIGLEGIVWSRLETLSQFRFPVQTADYFFGVYADWSDTYATWRFRVSHISSHLVDGADSITGGASSAYSREFVELTREVPLRTIFGEGLSWTLGVRGYFHQVTKIEPWIAFPASVTWRFADIAGFYGKGPNGPIGKSYPISLFVTSGDGPVWPSVAGGLRAERMASDLGVLGLQLEYYYGASWAGTDAGAKVSQLKLQLDVRDF
jgi:hypothetical protein